MLMLKTFALQTQRDGGEGICESPTYGQTCVSAQMFRAVRKVGCVPFGPLPETIWNTDIRQVQ